MISPIKGYLYFALGALLLIIARPAILNIVLFAIALFFILSGLSLLKDNWS